MVSGTERMIHLASTFVSINLLSIPFLEFLTSYWATCFVLSKVVVVVLLRSSKSKRRVSLVALINFDLYLVISILGLKSHPHLLYLWCTYFTYSILLNWPKSVKNAVSDTTLAITTSESFWNQIFALPICNHFALIACSSLEFYVNSNMGIRYHFMGIHFKWLFRWCVSVQP